MSKREYHTMYDMYLISYMFRRCSKRHPSMGPIRSMVFFIFISMAEKKRVSVLSNYESSWSLAIEVWHPENETVLYTREFFTKQHPQHHTTTHFVKCCSCGYSKQHPQHHTTTHFVKCCSCGYSKQHPQHHTTTHFVNVVVVCHL